MPSTDRSYSGGSIGLELQGVQCGFVKSVTGGAVTADVIDERAAGGGTNVTKKHIGQPRYEDLVIRAPFTLTPDLYEWIAASWKGGFERRNGAVTRADAKGTLRARRVFFNALVGSVTIPACDAASKDPAYLTVRISPEYTRDEHDPGKAPPPPGKQKQGFVSSNFRLEIDGLDCTRVSKVDAFTISQPPSLDPVGELRDLVREPAPPEFPTLRIQLAAAGAETWRAWFDEFVVKGRNDESAEKSGRLSLLSADRQAVLATIGLSGLGIFRLDDDWTASATDIAAPVTAELYCESMDIALGDAAAPMAARSRIAGIVAR